MLLCAHSGSVQHTSTTRTTDTKQDKNKNAKFCRYSQCGRVTPAALVWITFHPKWVNPMHCMESWPSLSGLPSQKVWHLIKGSLPPCILSQLLSGCLGHPRIIDECFEANAKKTKRRGEDKEEEEKDNKLQTRRRRRRISSGLAKTSSSKIRLGVSTESLLLLHVSMVSKSFGRTVVELYGEFRVWITRRSMSSGAGFDYH